MRRASLEDPRYFLNRHLSWLQFNRRVLEEARDTSNPLLERVKFLAITASNLDEFVEVRVAGLLQQAEQRRGEIGPDGLAPGELLPQLADELQQFVKDQYTCWRRGTRSGTRCANPFACERSMNWTRRRRKLSRNFIRSRVEPMSDAGDGGPGASFSARAE